MKQEDMLKDLHKVIDNVKTLEHKFNEQINKIDTRLTNISKKVSNINEKISLNEKNNQEKLEGAVNSLDEKQISIEQQFKKQLDTQFEFLKEKIGNIEKKLQEALKTKFEVQSTILKELKGQYSELKTKMINDLEALKKEHDTLKVSFTVKEKTLEEKIKLLIEVGIAKAVRGKEQEVLMRLWIDELKTIANDFQKLKKAHPKEFFLQLNEIAKSIEMFRHKLEI